MLIYFLFSIFYNFVLIYIVFKQVKDFVLITSLLDYKTE